MNIEFSTEDTDLQSPWYPTGTGYQIFASIPFIGIVASQFLQAVIDKGIQESNQLDKIIDLLELKNEYKKCSLFSSVLSTAIVIATFVAPILPAICFGMVGMHSYMAISHNERLIATLKNPNTTSHASLKFLTQ